MTASTPPGNDRGDRGDRNKKARTLAIVAPPTPKDDGKAAADLRQRAEASMRSRMVEVAPDTGVDAQADPVRMLHELQVHQVELELQNEELRRANDELSALHARYHDLYDFAPVAYFTIDGDRRLVEANLAGARMLGQDRARLPQRRISEFVHPNSLVVFEQLLGRAMMKDTLLEDALVVRPQNAEPVHVKVQARRVDGTNGGQVRLVMMDVSALRRANEDLAHSLETFFRYFRP